MRIGILGGTFNPPHNGHYLAAKHVHDALGLDRVFFIPTNLPPHKKLPAGSAATQQRCEMVRLMIQDLSWAELNTMEIDRGGASYTVDTLRQLKKEYPEDELFLIMGTDMLLMLDDGWRAPDEICRLCTLAVVARAEEDRQQLEEKAEQLRALFHADIRLVDCPVLTISSTELRTGNALYTMLPPAVYEYIEEEKLYIH